MKYIFALLFLPLFVFSEESYNVSLCDTCFSPDSFRTAAINTGYKNQLVVIINTETGGARAYFVAPPGAVVTEFNYAKPKNLPADVQPAIDEYFIIKNAFDSIVQSVNSGVGSAVAENKYDVQVNVMSANGCGTPSDGSYHVIPDFPFYEACNNHDLCYEGSSSKGFCDSQFLFNMDSIVTSMPVNYFPVQLRSLAGVVLFRFLLYKQAGLYYFAVTNSQRALDSYCNNTLYDSPAECFSDDFDMVESKGQRSGLYIYNN